VSISSQFILVFFWGRTIYNIFGYRTYQYFSCLRRTWW